ncbi:MAG: excisionase family DNA-binding protein [Acholeplasmatales bacterium]|nr:excisionase family DNA-binding protein [Acholeplasmatales bacterium]
MEKTTMTVHELAIQLGISIPKAYELIKSPNFPSIRIGSRIIIPIDEYKKWLKESSGGKTDEINNNL